MSYSSSNVLNSIVVCVTSEQPAVAEDTSRKFDPGKAAVVAAVLGLIGVLGAALIGKMELFLKDAKVGQVLAVQQDKYREIMAGIATAANDVKTEKEKLKQKKLPAAERTRVERALNEAEEKIETAQTVLPTQMANYERQMRAGDSVEALHTTEEMNRALVQQRSFTAMAFSGTSGQPIELTRRRGEGRYFYCPRMCGLPIGLVYTLPTGTDSFAFLKKPAVAYTPTPYSANVNGECESPELTEPCRVMPSPNN